MQTIDVHVVDVRGVYLRTESVGFYGPQPEGAVYVELPDAQDGHTRVWLGGAWQQVPDDEVPPMPGPAPEPAPQQCTRRQGRLALLSHGHLDDVEAAIEAIEDPTEQRAARIEYEADTWERSNPVVQQMWQQLGGTPEQLDDLFRLAVTL